MKRVVIPELLDDDTGTPREVADSLADLRMFNRRFGGGHVTSRLLLEIATRQQMTAISFLDVAGASGDIVTMSARFLAQHGITLNAVLLDRAPSHLNGTHPAVCGDALELPFPDNSFDVVGSSLFLHHLEPGQIVAFTNEALRVARHAFLVNDLVRNPIHLALAEAGRLIYRSRITRHDAPASVRRAYTVKEMREFIAQTRAQSFEIGTYYFFRMGGIAWKCAYDLTVIGAGPAGSACAITAARAGASVLLLEKDQFPRHKVCGEFVSPESLHLLEWLLGEKRFENRPEVKESRVFSGRKVITLPISPCARSIPRYELDMALLQAAREAGVHAEESVTVREVEQQDNFRIRTNDKTYTARAVVNATGRWSQLTQHRPRQKEKWIGLKAHFQEAGPPPSTDLYFFDGGYCGVQPVGPDSVNACAMVRADAARTLQEVFGKHPELRARTRDWQPLFAPITTSSLYFRKPQTEHRGMVLAGDAAAFIDPFAGDGISMALHTGSLAAESLLGFLRAKSSLTESQQQYRTAYFRRFAPAFRNAARLRMLLSAPAWLCSKLIRLAGTRPVARMIVQGTRARAS
jgi:flavin-dependent dehydrogenase/ubiquinone/menaquinone biosynthesis C-methylase UbiE